jgi:hypothetical protein
MKRPLQQSFGDFEVYSPCPQFRNWTYSTAVEDGYTVGDPAKMIGGV